MPITKKITEELTFISKRLISLQIPLMRNELVHIIALYTLTTVSDGVSIARFNLELTETLLDTDLRDKVVLLGDFNARVGARDIYVAKLLVFMDKAR